MDSKTFDNIKNDIIKELTNMEYTSNCISDIGNEVGVAIGKYTMLENAEELYCSKDDFISGLEHGISLIDGTH